jgi:hypothetical protein
MYRPWPAAEPAAIPGRVELRALLLAYILTLALQIVTTGAVLKQGSTPIVALTAIHAALVAAMFWMLFFNGLVATQVRCSFLEFSDISWQL